MKKILALFLCFGILSSCANSDIVATVGTEKITRGEFEFYLSSIKSQLSGTELKTDEDWQTQEIEGEKAIDAAKQRALEIAVLNAEYREAAKAQNMRLNEQEKENVKTTKQQVISSYGGDTAYKQFLKDNNITDSFIQLMCESTVYYEKLADKVAIEEPTSDEELLKYYEDNIKTLSEEYKKAKHILILTQDKDGKALSEEEQEAAKELAESLFERIKAGEDFDALMRKYSKDPGLSSNPEGYVFTSGEMVPEFEQAADSVSAGEIAMCKSVYGYHIIKRLPIEYGDIADKVEALAMKEKINARLKEWEAQYNIVIKVNEELIKTIK
ncbi:MAG: peptidylprolyl isomerase [Clostridia bacterium]|nr:peptidylprolyl isomerase [Clostridia bacterium]